MGLGTGDGVGRSCAWGCVYAIVKTVKQSNPLKGAPSRNTTALMSSCIPIKLTSVVQSTLLDKVEQ